MTALRFRNIDADPRDPVSTWPTEGVIAALERGGLSDWRRLAAEIRRDPWGPVSRRLEDALQAVQPYGVHPMMERALLRARASAETEERAQVARRIHALWLSSGLDRAGFAQRIGTSASRLSTYLSGKVTPSAALLVRMERVAAEQGDGIP